jgi:HK97 family phage major capsid protein
MTIQQLREARNELSKKMQHLNAEHKDKWSNDLQKQFDELGDKLAGIDQQIANEEKLLALAGEQNFTDAPLVKDTKNGQNANALSESAMFRAWAIGGTNNLTAEQAAQFANTMSVGGPGTEGGFTVQTDVATSFLEALKDFGAMRKVSTIVATERGNQLIFPTTDGTNEIGEIVNENTAAGSQDLAFGTKALGAYKYSSKIVVVPFELLQDSQIDVEALVMKRLRERIGRIHNKHFTTGTGTAQPLGMMTALTAGKVGAAGQTATVTYDDLIDLYESIDQAYLDMGKSGFMFHQQVRALLRKLKDTAGRPIWLPSYEGGIGQGVDESLLGQKVIINNDMATPAANAKTIAFGDFSNYQIRDVKAVELFRFADSPFISKGQIGFLAWARASGGWTDIGGAAKAYQHSAS